jgi:uncharacterized membrane protein YeaQ/YmgE (transglycosylase-associated protein family)
MKWMAIGEVGAFLLSIVAAVWFAASLDESAMFVRVVGALVVLYVVARAALGFVHLGYVPNKDEGRS